MGQKRMTGHPLVKVPDSPRKMEAVSGPRSSHISFPERCASSKITTTMKGRLALEHVRLGQPLTP